MKKSLKPLMFSLILLCFMAFARTGIAQGPVPPPPPDVKGSNENKGPAGAPIDPGTGIFLILAAGYGMKKVYDGRRKSAG